MRAHRNKGFTLVEMSIALAIMTILTVATVPYLQTKMDTLRAEKTADEMKAWLEAGMAYYSANGAWPADTSVLVAANYMPASAVTNPWGNAYSVQVVGANFEVQTDFNKYGDLGASRLPLSSKTGNTVTAQVVVPGTETAHSRLLNRYGDNNQNVMQAPLDMNGNTVTNASTVQAKAGQTLVVSGNQGLTVESATSGINASAQNADGSVNSNDLFLRSLSGANKWLSARLGHFVADQSYLVGDGALIPKPNCAAAGTPKVFLEPRYLSMEYQSVSGRVAFELAAPSVSALYWQAYVREYGVGGAHPAGLALARTYCYY